jgi:hypothetical protein
MLSIQAVDVLWTGMTHGPPHDVGSADALVPPATPREGCPEGVDVFSTGSVYQVKGRNNGACRLTAARQVTAKLN